MGLAVDPQGRLYVADSGNGRVLRFPAPFAYTGGGQEKADLVLGQQDFGPPVLDPTARTMKQPYGLAFSGTNGLLVSDLSFNRVLYFKFTSNNIFHRGERQRPGGQQSLWPVGLLRRHQRQRQHAAQRPPSHLRGH